MKKNLIKIKEHEEIIGTDLERIKELSIPFCDTRYMQEPIYLGINPEYKASYYIGAEWLHEESNLAMVILPKIDNIDFTEMYLSVLQSNLAPDYFSKIYNIDFRKNPIETDALKEQLNPLIIFHFLSLIRRIIKKGLKINHIVKEENLKSKVKGHIKTIKNERLNIISKKYDRFYCEYNDYSIDNYENRLLKKALLFSKRYISLIKNHHSYYEINALINSFISCFDNVSDEIEIYQVRKITQHKIYRDYNEALRIAKLILQRYGYSTDNINQNYKKIPPFWIDMSRLYEVYVYGLLYKAYGDNIQFQVEGYNRSAVDFIKKDEDLIIDTKYKPAYCDGNKGILDDIRQISGYARDEKILKQLRPNNDDKSMPSCLIIYPEKMELDDKELVEFSKDNLLETAAALKSFRNFYKLSVSLPHR